jgi:iron complex outermembrane receptor protein
MLFAQNPIDSLKTQPVEEVVVISAKNTIGTESKPLTSLDNYLEKAGAINMIRRGSYAFEPFVNGMSSERSVITIDGMRIYGACTDKMDPVTSYVEITNLAKANIHGSPSGRSGATIAGSIDLVRKKGTFGGKNLSGQTFGGFETNNSQKIAGFALSHSSSKFFVDTDFTWRDADNYTDGDGNEILYSQFTKYNVSAIAGYKLGDHEHIEASVIYDHATDVGYPALPMDVSLARAVITSVEYVRHHISPKIHQLKAKLYYNEVTHTMDDSQRPDVPIRMDMPGWSKTTGFYSLLEGEHGKHVWKAKVSAHRNSSLAEMTMFSNNPAEPDMFMLTWPGVLTNYADVFAEDEFQLTDRWLSKVSLGVAGHGNTVDNQFGLESIRIFFPDAKRTNIRLLKRLSASVENRMGNTAFNLGIGYGERAPSVSEGYGFYLFNSFDRFDYIGNPNMKNEKSASVTAGISYVKSKFSAKWTATHFYISDYIIGVPQIGLSPMTIGAEGIKIYEQLDYANIFNTAVDIGYKFSDRFNWTNQVSYRNGTAKDITRLPLIQPLSYNSTASYTAETWSFGISINGAARQEVNADFGERPLPSYCIAGVNASKRFALVNQNLVLKAGIENLLDADYTTFADWNRIPRMGRNFFLHVVYDFR